ncbi:hypothetical protein ABXT00_07600 [Stenotrophomonas koreensis]|uniref:hypothetical protein n=1 Tax=Stenotrophomonas koreensis TaxID=266128 RepID=UPI00339A2CE1
MAANMRRTLVGSTPRQWLAGGNVQQGQTTGESVDKQQETLSGQAVAQRKWTGLVAWRLIVMTLVWIVAGGAFLLTRVLAVEGTMLALGVQLLGIVYRPLTFLVVAVALLTLVQWFYRERWLVFQQKRGCLLLLGILVLAGFYPALMGLDALQIVPDSSGDALLHDAGQFD